MKRILRLYPAAWRRRYGDELSDLLDEMPSSPTNTLDLLRGAVTLHMRALIDRLAPRLLTAGGPPMPTHPLQRHPTATALLAALIAAPIRAISSIAGDVSMPMTVRPVAFATGIATRPFPIASSTSGPSACTARPT